MREEDFEKRVFRYHPGAQRLVLIFFVYQVKNMYDTLYWNDGPEFVAHHILAGMAAWVSYGLVSVLKQFLVGLVLKIICHFIHTGRDVSWLLPLLHTILLWFLRDLHSHTLSSCKL
jgi:hypothetical protein